MDKNPAIEEILALLSSQRFEEADDSPTTKELQSALGWSDTRINNVILDLCRKGQIEAIRVRRINRVGNPITTYGYRVKKSAQDNAAAAS